LGARSMVNFLVARTLRFVCSQRYLHAHSSVSHPPPAARRLTRLSVHALVVAIQHLGGAEARQRLVHAGGAHNLEGEVEEGVVRVAVAPARALDLAAQPPAEHARHKRRLRHAGRQLARAHARRLHGLDQVASKLVRILLQRSKAATWIEKEMHKCVYASAAAPACGACTQAACGHAPGGLDGSCAQSGAGS
jgi:hypothetical protein